MARWTVGEAIIALKSRDKEAREDIGRTCPLFVTATYEEILETVDLMTARQVEARLRSMMDDKAEESEVEEKPKKKRKKKQETEKPKRRKKKAKKEVEPEDEVLDDDSDESDDGDSAVSLDEDEEDFLDDIFDDEE